MSRKKLTTGFLAFENIKRNRFRSIGLLVTVACFSFTILFGTVLVGSLENGIQTMAGRIGADLMLVPKGSETDFQGSLLRSEPSTFYLQEHVLNDVASLDGIEIASPQLFIASLNAACCSVPVQLIGFDPETDFTVKNWLLNVWNGSLNENDVVIGNSIVAEPGDTLYFFNRPYKVAAKLDSTGMGMDSSVLMNQQTAQKMIEASGQQLPDTLVNGEKLISAVMIKLNEEADAEAVAAKISSMDPDVDVIVSDDFLRDISQKLNGISGLTGGVTLLIWIVAVFVLFFVFSIVLNARKKEFGLLVSLGATRAKLAGILLYESVYISAIGAACGILAACLVLFPFQTLIANSMELPYLIPPLSDLLRFFLMTVGISVLIGPVSCMYSVLKLSKTDVYSLIKEIE